MYLYEETDNIDRKRYFYEVFTETDNNGALNRIKIYLTLRGVPTPSAIEIILEKDDIAKILDNKISKIIKKLYKEHINYRGESGEKEDFNNQVV